MNYIEFNNKEMNLKNEEICIILDQKDLELEKKNIVIEDLNMKKMILRRDILNLPLDMKHYVKYTRNWMS